MTHPDIVTRAREAYAKLTPFARRAVRGRVATIGPRTGLALYNAGLIGDGGGLTALGRTVRDGWTCERCEKWHDATETRFSAADCNETGRGVALCEECVPGR